MGSVLTKIDTAACLNDWLTEPDKFGHLLGYKKLTPLHGEWIKIFLKNKKFDILQAHRLSYKTTCGIVAMILLFLCLPNMRLLIVRKNKDLASEILNTIKNHFEKSDILKLYLYSRWGILNVQTKTWSSEHATFFFKKDITPQPSMTAVGIGTSIVGAHFDYIWMDDIVALEDRYSPAERKKTIAYFNETENLIEPLGSRRLSGTPWHEEDVFSILPDELFEGRQFPIGTVDIPINELEEIKSRKDRLPYAEWCCNYELRHVLDHDTLGSFLSVPEWKCQYSVAFIDPSFSDRKDTDSTAVAIAGVWDSLIIFTGRLWQKSIADDETRKEILDFLNVFTPIESVLESQLAPSSNVFFLDALKQDEIKYKYEIKNYWSIKHQTRNKHERISTIISANKINMRILENTQQNFSLEVSRYYKNAEHDDACLIGNTKIVTLYGNKNIKDIKKGEYVFTPFGFRKVLESKCTGEKEIINIAGLNITSNHQIYSRIKNNFIPADSLTGKLECDVLSIRGIIKWQMLKMLYLTEENILNRGTIIFLAKQKKNQEKIANNYIKRCGSFIIKKKSPKDIIFTTKILIQIIMIFLILNYFQLKNIYLYMVKRILRMKNIKRIIKNNWIISETKQKNGTQVLLGKNGISSISKNLWPKHGFSGKKEYASCVVKNIFLKLNGRQNIAQLNVAKKTDLRESKKEKVYNLTVKGGMFYANKILVSNCDALAGAIEALGTSDIVAEYARAVDIIKRR